jgi:hypothetical protein
MFVSLLDDDTIQMNMKELEEDYDVTIDEVAILELRTILEDIFSEERNLTDDEITKNLIDLNAVDAVYQCFYGSLSGKYQKYEEFLENCK